MCLHCHLGQALYILLTATTNSLFKNDKARAQAIREQVQGHKSRIKVVNPNPVVTSQVAHCPALGKAV